jgi:putative spermidine/putrescine transport system permease protein
MVPAIVLGVATLQFLVIFGFLGTYRGILVGHMLVTLPYAVRLVAISFGGFNWDLYRAAVGLGASPFYAVRRVVLPLIRPGLVGAATFSFILSFDEVTISLFTTGPRISTLPVEIFRWAEFSFDPIIAAASAIMVGIVAVGVVIIQATVGIETVFGQELSDD